MNKLSILIFDGSKKKATFINRLIKGLVEHGHKVTVAEFHSDKKNRITGATYINLGSERKKLSLVLESLILLIVTLFKRNFFRRFLRLVKGFLNLNIKEIRKVNLVNAILKTKPDIVHLQWLSLLPFCEELLDKGLTKFVLSQRGTHINVRPFIDGENFSYLKRVFAKIDGFHSVSKAIQEKSNLIYTSKQKVDEVVYSGINIADIDFNKQYFKGKTLNLLSVGRPHWIKGYAAMIKVCSMLKNEGLDFKYTIIGTNTNEEELLYLIAHYSLEDRVILKPKVSQETVFKINEIIVCFGATESRRRYC
jgi:colanic acid/amylovoran biosynthesis glycosyltransferase